MCLPLLFGMQVQNRALTFPTPLLMDSGPAGEGEVGKDLFSYKCISIFMVSYGLFCTLASISVYFLQHCLSPPSLPCVLPSQAGPTWLERGWGCSVRGPFVSWIPLDGSTAASPSVLLLARQKRFCSLNFCSIQEEAETGLRDYSIPPHVICLGWERSKEGRDLFQGEGIPSDWGSVAEVGLGQALWWAFWMWN